MENKIKTFRLFVRPDARSNQIAEKIRTLSAKSESPLIEAEDADLVIAIGGDGTFIDAVTNTNFSKNIIYTGIHTGTLGFLQDTCENDIFSLIKYISYEKELKTRKIYTAFVEVFSKDNSSIYQFFSLNEVLVVGENYSKISFAQYVNGELLQNVSGNGIAIATSTGDTAYSLNANGAIDFSNNFQLVCTLQTPIRNAAYERFITNPIICSKINIVLKPSENISLIIDGKKKEIPSSNIERIQVSMVDDSNYINKLDIMNYSKVRIVREKILGYDCISGDLRLLTQNNFSRNI